MKMLFYSTAISPHPHVFTQYKRAQISPVYNAFVRVSGGIRVMMVSNWLFFNTAALATVETSVRPSCAEPMEEERRWFGRMPSRQARVRPSAHQMHFAPGQVRTRVSRSDSRVRLYSVCCIIIKQRWAPRLLRIIPYTTADESMPRIYATKTHRRNGRAKAMAVRRCLARSSVSKLSMSVQSFRAYP